MNPQLIWIIALSISTSIGGLVGFAIQLHEIKKSRLVNVKLQLEIEELKKRAAEADKRIVHATTEEVIKFNDVRFSIRDKTNDKLFTVPEPKTSFKDFAIGGSIILCIIILVGYFIFDIYRIVVWLSSNL